MIKYLSKIIKFNHLYVISIIKTDVDEYFNILEITKKGNKIEINKMVSVKIISRLLEIIDIKLPVILLIDGKGVLNKEINLRNEADLEWQKNIDYNSIYFTSVLGLNSSFISFIRKNIVDESIAKFKSKNIQIIDIYIGAFLTALLQNSINKNVVNSNDLELQFEANKLIGFKKNEVKESTNFTLGNEPISNEYLPQYGALIHFLIKPIEVTKTQNETLNIEEIIYKKAFNLFGISMLVGFFSMLFLSYILIQYYGSKNADLNADNQDFNKSYQLILDLEKQKESKLTILQESGLLSSKYLSFYGFEIVKSTPIAINLNQINIRPLEAEIKINKKVVFDANTILVNGSTSNEISIDNWLLDLKKMNWVNKLEIISLRKDKNNESQFIIKITLKNV